MKFARYSFLIAGIYGILVLLPQYFLIEKNGSDFPPPITHAEYYYGFIGVALAFQVVFLMTAADPLKYRIFMLASVVEKFSYGIPVVLLYLQGHVSGVVFTSGILDSILGVLFIISYLKTAGLSPPRSTGD